MHVFEVLVTNSIFFYALLLIILFSFFVFISSVAINRYVRKNKYVWYKELLVSPYAPSVSIIAPVFNIENSVIDAVRALLLLKYNNFDVIVVNDGSTDSTLEKLKEFYQLESVDYAVGDQLKTQMAYSYYKSQNPAFAKLMVIDKVAGGQADALNAGINASEKDWVFCTGQQCFLDPNSLLKLVKRVLEQKKRVIAVECVVNIANSSDVKNGHLSNIKFPKDLLPAFQVIEYFRLFLIESIAWSRLNGLHILSGTIGLFDKEILLLSGGYSTKALKPGFELLVRMRRYMYDNMLEHKVVCNTEPICLVDGIANLKKLGEQRKNCAAGILQTFRLNKDIFFNKKYGTLGLLNFPYLFLSEWITPFFKVLSLVLLSVLSIVGVIKPEFAIILLSMIYCFSVLLSLISILLQEKAYRLYSSGRDMLRIVILAFIEPFIYHPITVYWKIASGKGKKEC